MKRVSIIRVFICILVLLVIGCGKTEPSPKEILSKYSDSYFGGRYEEAYQYISAKDKAVKSLQEYLSDSATENPLAQALMSQFSYEIKEITVTENQAKANVEIIGPDFKAIFGELLGEAFKTAFGGQKDQQQIEQMLEEKYKDKKIPKTTTIKSFDLEKEADGWKVFLDWETQKKTSGLMKQAMELQKEKKLYAAKEKYQEVMELGGEKVRAAETLSKELDKQIASFEEKQAYINNVVLYDLKGRYYTTYLDRKIPGVEFKLKNKGDRTLKKVEVTVYFEDATGTIIAEKRYYPVLVTEYSFGSDKNTLKPNYIWQLESGKFYKADAVPSEWKQGAVSAKITDIEFADR